VAKYNLLTQTSAHDWKAIVRKLEKSSVGNTME